MNWNYYWNNEESKSLLGCAWTNAWQTSSADTHLFITAVHMLTSVNKWINKSNDVIHMSERQSVSLEDYIETAIMLQYNER